MPVARAPVVLMFARDDRYCARVGVCAAGSVWDRTEVWQGVDECAARRCTRYPARFVNTRLKLFAGIATTRSQVSPAVSPSATTASISRTPHSGSRLFNH
ncbi:hypothetical protein OKW39_008021 [Paraburkholderia sp. MM6662-R1]